jgi:hypothetical protein
MGLAMGLEHPAILGGGFAKLLYLDLLLIDQ